MYGREREGGAEKGEEREREREGGREGGRERIGKKAESRERERGGREEDEEKVNKFLTKAVTAAYNQFYGKISEDHHRVKCIQDDIA